MYKRKFRELSQATKDKISASMKGRRKSSSHAQHISSGMKVYWDGVPSKNDDETTNEDVML